jgi:hypothetical protein
MPYVNTAMHAANHAFAPIEEVDAQRLAPALREAGSLADVADKLGLYDLLPQERRGELRTFLDSVPPSLDAAIRGAMLSAVQRGLHTQLMWKPAYDWAVEMWEVADGIEPPGALSVLLQAPHPFEEGAKRG